MLMMLRNRQMALPKYRKMQLDFELLKTVVRENNKQRFKIIRKPVSTDAAPISTDAASTSTPPTVSSASAGTSTRRPSSTASSVLPPDIEDDLKPDPSNYL